MEYNEELEKEVPKGWELKTMNDVCLSITNGSTPRRAKDEYWNGKIPWFKTGELTDGPLIKSEEYITNMGLENSACKLLDINTILIALYASPTVGRLGLVKIRSTCNQACSALVAKEELGYSFLFYTLFFKRIELNNVAVGAAQQNINQEIIKKNKILIPTSKILNKFNILIESFFNKQTNIAIESKNLTYIRDYFLPKLMSGKIRV